MPLDRPVHAPETAEGTADAAPLASGFAAYGGLAQIINRALGLLALAAILAMLLVACGDEEEPTATTATPVPTATATQTATPTATPTPTPTPVPTATSTGTVESTPVPTATATQTATPTATPTPTPTPVPTATSTGTVESTPVPTATATQTATPTATPTPQPTATPTPTAVPISMVVESPPPTWIFIGSIPVEHQKILREEMEAVRGYFSERFSVEATGFTVVVAADHEEFHAVYREVVGHDISSGFEFYSPKGIQALAWVMKSPSGGAVITLHYMVPTPENFDFLRHYIAHEYFHVLQGQLATGFARLPNGEIAWHNEWSSFAPKWLVEGSADYADHAYTLTRTGRRSYKDRTSSYEDIEFFQNEGHSIKLADYGVVDLSTIGCIPYLDYLLYPLGFLAFSRLAERVGENAYVNYWKIAGERPTWQQAFEETFGIGSYEFYGGFDEWLPQQLPSHVRLSLQMVWRNTGNREGDISVEIEGRHGAPWGDWEAPFAPILQIGVSGSLVRPDNMGNPYGRVTYTEGAVGTGYISLWWTDDHDQCTNHLLGWYKDGELTNRREDATPVEFIGADDTLDWSLPGHPSTLPRLESRTHPFCK